MQYNHGLIPCPSFVEESEGYFAITQDTRIVINEEDLRTKKMLLDLQKDIESEIGICVSMGSVAVKASVNIYLIQEDIGSELEDAYELEIEEDHIYLRGYQKGIYYGIKTLIQLIVRYKNKLPTMKIKDEPSFKSRGWLLDITRGKVPKLEYLMEIVELASDFKINMIQLYVEHTFMFDFTTEINLGKDGLTSADILTLDSYCQEHMITLVPCIATFGHLYELLKSDSYGHLCEYNDYANEPYNWLKRQLHHTLDCRNPESIDLVKRLLENYVPLFSSPIVNICGDETFDIGKGKNKELAERVGASKIYVEFLVKIMEIVKGMGKKVMFFGDVIIKHPEYINELPEDVICMNWNYDPIITEDDTCTFQQSGIAQYVCPGVTGWNRALNDYQGAFQNITTLIKFGKKYGAEGVLTTDWGDFGNINCLSASLPGLILGAAMSWNTKDQNCNSLKEFQDSIGIHLGYEGMESLSPFSLLVDISEKMNITWEHLMIWYYDVAFGHVSYGGDHEFIKGPDSYLFRKTMNELDILIDRLEELKCKAYSRLSFSKRQDVEEYVHMARLVRHMQHLGLMIKELYFNKNNIKELVYTDLRQEANDLAVQLENWQIQYEKLWRVRNRESELYRIRETIVGLCHYLRQPGV